MNTAELRDSGETCGGLNPWRRSNIETKKGK
jgi:hypothetical protein